MLLEELAEVIDMESEVFANLLDARARVTMPNRALHVSELARHVEVPIVDWVVRVRTVIPALPRGHLGMVAGWS